MNKPLLILILLSFIFLGSGRVIFEKNLNKIEREGKNMSDEKKTILAIGAHAGDMEISCGAVLLKQSRSKDQVVFLHLTLGEGGNPGLSAAEYGKQKEREAREVDSALGGTVIFGPYRDGELPNDDTARRYVANVIRKVKPSIIITHWKNSIHPDHSNAHLITVDAVLLASLPSVKTVTQYSSEEYSAWRGVRHILYTENWEDMDGFEPYIYVDVTDSFDSWVNAVARYEFIGGKISTFPYLSYYRSLSGVRGAESGFTRAVAFDIDKFEKKIKWKSLE